VADNSMAVGGVLALSLALLSCAQSQAIQDRQRILDEARRTSEESQQWAAQLEARRRVNENWSVDCTVDQVTGTRRCFAATFGQAMDHEGKGYGARNIPFQIYYLLPAPGSQPPPPPPPGVASQENLNGPFVLVGFHSYPGMKPTVRVDDNAPLTVRDSAGGEARGRDQELVEQLLIGTVARARYYIWPDGPKDMIVDLTGIKEAWERLQELTSKM
jgi:hypothetical protein